MKSKLSNDISKATGPIGLKFYISVASLGWRSESLCFYENWLFSLVAMATYIFHRLMMGKIEIWHLLPNYCRYLDKNFIEMFLR